MTAPRILEDHNAGHQRIRAEYNGQTYEARTTGFEWGVWRVVKDGAAVGVPTFETTIALDRALEAHRGTR